MDMIESAHNASNEPDMREIQNIMDIFEGDQLSPLLAPTLQPEGKHKAARRGQNRRAWY
jgi:hypothetical protein